jgi:hypothetical protein
VETEPRNQNEQVETSSESTESSSYMTIEPSTSQEFIVPLLVALQNELDNLKQRYQQQQITAIMYADIYIDIVNRYAETGISIPADIFIYAFLLVQETEHVEARRSSDTTCCLIC